MSEFSSAAPQESAPSAPGPDVSAQNAANELTKRKEENGRGLPPVEEVVLDKTLKFESDGKESGAKKAANALTDYRRTREENKRAMQKALGLNIPTDEPPEENQDVPSPRPVQEPQDPAKKAPGSKEPEKIQVESEARSNHAKALATTHVLIQREFASEYPEIRWSSESEGLADLQALAARDPGRAERAVRKIMHAREVASAFDRLAAVEKTESQKAFQDWSAKQDDAFLEKNPELKDPKVANALRGEVIETLKEVGLSGEELSALWHGDMLFSLRDGRCQSLLLDAARYRAGKKLRMQVERNASLPAVRPPSHTQRPGASRPSNAGRSEIQAANKALNDKGDVRSAVRLLSLRRQRGN